MCYFCHTLGNNPDAPPHRSPNCLSPNNTHSQKARPPQAAVLAPAPSALSPPVLREIRTLSGKNRIHPCDVDVRRGAQIWDGEAWRRILAINTTGPNTRRVVFVTGGMGTPERFLDVTF